MISNSARETQKIAANLAQSLDKSTVLTLTGELGAGKTNFIQGLAKGLGIDRRVLSPTFVFVRSYRVENKPFKIFHHVDLYRAQNLESVKSTGIEEILNDQEALIAIEWPELVENLLPTNHLKVVFKKISENGREITIS